MFIPLATATLIATGWPMTGKSISCLNPTSKLGNVGTYGNPTMIFFRGVQWLDGPTRSIMISALAISRKRQPVPQLL
jgi:hypothetical protein